MKTMEDSDMLARKLRKTHRALQRHLSYIARLDGKWQRNPKHATPIRDIGSKAPPKKCYPLDRGATKRAQTEILAGVC